MKFKPGMLVRLKKEFEYAYAITTRDVVCKVIKVWRKNMFVSIVKIVNDDISDASRTFLMSFIEKKHFFEVEQSKFEPYIETVRL